MTPIWEVPEDLHDHSGRHALIMRPRGPLRALGPADRRRARLRARALAIRERALGPDHADTASSLNNLLLLQARGELAAARLRVVVSGVGAMGMTHVAHRYVRRHRARYRQRAYAARRGPSSTAIWPAWPSS